MNDQPPLLFFFFFIGFWCQIFQKKSIYDIYKKMLSEYHLSF